MLLIWGATGLYKTANSQVYNNIRADYGSLNGTVKSSLFSGNTLSSEDDVMNIINEDSLSDRPPREVPKPASVMYKSMLLPGWGQVVNQQAWKIPIVYGLLAGVTYYSIYLNGKYNDYKAAYYNMVYPDREQKFGPTPDYINPNIGESSLKSIRNDFRNRRDKAFIGIGLAYGLNIVDAYVFAHLRDFDVSDDLSMNMNIDNGSKLTSTDIGVFSEGIYENSVMISLNFKLKTQ